MHTSRRKRVGGKFGKSGCGRRISVLRTMTPRAIPATVSRVAWPSSTGSFRSTRSASADPSPSLPVAPPPPSRFRPACRRGGTVTSTSRRGANGWRSRSSASWNACKSRSYTSQTHSAQPLAQQSSGAGRTGSAVAAAAVACACCCCCCCCCELRGEHHPIRGRGINLHTGVAIIRKLGTAIVRAHAAGDNWGGR